MLLIQTLNLRPETLANQTPVFSRPPNLSRASIGTARREAEGSVHLPACKKEFKVVGFRV